jgi:hypothetical protein
VNRRIVVGVAIALILAAIGVSIGFQAADWHRGVDAQVVDLAGQGETERWWSSKTIMASSRAGSSCSCSSGSSSSGSSGA